jgi:peptidoglycan/LPS O-acetylase OafA/YrhL
MLLTGIAISLIKYIPDYFLNNHTQYLKQNGLITLFKGWRYSDEMFNITFFITWFLPGVMFYHLYKGLQLKKNIFIGICCVGMIYCLLRDIRNIYVGSLYTVIFATLLMFALFSIMIYRKKYLLFLEISFLKRVGIISYTIYLIHEDIGILLISKFGKYLGNWGALWPFIVIFLAIGFAELSYRFYERKANIFLKKIFNNRGKIFLNKHIADTS